MSLRGAARSFSVPPTSLRRYIDVVKYEFENLDNVTDAELEASLKQNGTYAACSVNQVGLNKINEFQNTY